MVHKVFISFSAKDKHIADSLTRELAKAGDEVSSAALLVEGPSDIKLGIADAMRESDEVIAIVSKNSVRSEWLSFEVGIAAGLGKKLIPVVVGIAPSELPPVLRSFQTVDLAAFRRQIGRRSYKPQGRT